MATYFSKDYVQFFKDLSKNNTKDWFQDNRKRYETEVKEPFKSFTQALIDMIASHDSTVKLEPKKAISRINRDIRFSKDKTPYNLHLNAFIAPLGRKDPNHAAFAVRLSPEMLGIMGGLYQPDKNQLAKIRSLLSKGDQTLATLLQEKKFVHSFGSLKGETMKRIPKDLRDAAESNPLILQKQFYYVKEESSDLISSDKLMESLEEAYLTMKPINDYLTSIIQ